MGGPKIDCCVMQSHPQSFVVAWKAPKSTGPLLARNVMMKRQINILLVEDDELDVMNVRRVFRDVPTIASITVARDGAEALQILRSGALSLHRLLVLLDLRMPRMNGLEFLQHIRHDWSLNLLPVVVLTTSNDASDLRQAYQLHVAGYLLKPVSLPQFRDCMQRLQQYWSHVEFPWDTDAR